jgi:hypothetical protein
MDPHKTLTVDLAIVTCCKHHVSNNIDKLSCVKFKNHACAHILVLVIWNTYRVFALTFDPPNLYRYARDHLWLRLEVMKRYWQDCVRETEKPCMRSHFGVLMGGTRDMEYISGFCSNFWSTQPLQVCSGPCMVRIGGNEAILTRLRAWNWKTMHVLCFGGWWYSWYGIHIGFFALTFHPPRKHVAVVTCNLSNRLWSYQQIDLYSRCNRRVTDIPIS